MRVLPGSPLSLGSGGGLTLHRVLHVLSKEVPHHLSTDLPYIQFLGEPGKGGKHRNGVDQPSTWRYVPPTPPTCLSFPICRTDVTTHFQKTKASPWVQSRVPFPSTYSLVQAGCVGILVLLDNGDYQGDELGPEVQVFDAGALLLGGHLAFLSLE